MTERFRLPRLQIATKLYGAIALILAVVYMLAAAATLFASRTEESVRRFHEEGYAAAVLSGKSPPCCGVWATAPRTSCPGSPTI